MGSWQVVRNFWLLLSETGSPGGFNRQIHQLIFGLTYRPRNREQWEGEGPDRTGRAGQRGPQ
jgi:hypothetical protein